jgi:arylsulfatase A-like enzyme
MGDDSFFMMDTFEEFLTRKAPGGKEEAPFMAVLWLHTNHMPHPAMPEFYHGYTDANGQPAGDYLGTLSQMDVQIGRLRQMLKDKGVAENTALWFTADNGPHTSSGGGCTGQFARSSNQATNGLRQCKASLFEGGIREPGILEWPAMIKAHRETEMPAYVSDYLPTFLDVVGIPHENPSWVADGISLMPFIRQANELSESVVNVMVNRTKPLVFNLGQVREEAELAKQDAGPMLYLVVEWRGNRPIEGAPGYV